MALTADGLIAFICTLSTVATIAVGLRMFVRAVMRNIGPEDILTAVSWAFTIISASCAAATLKAGSHEQPKIGREFYVAINGAVLSLSLGKAGVGLALLRLSGPNVPRRWTLQACQIVLAILSLGALLINVVQPCSQQRASNQAPFCVEYDSRIEEGLVLAWSVYGAVLDIVFSVVAMMIVHAANLNRQKRTALYVLFGLGWLAAPFSILRAFAGRTVTNNMGLLFVSTMTEMFLVLVCSSVPTLMPLFRGWNQTGLGTVRHGGCDSVTGTARRGRSKTLQRTRIRDVDAKWEQGRKDEDESSSRFERSLISGRGRSRHPRM